ncbi:hypothetical protein [Tahibacter harae]|uniref:Replication restart DNA helicase PriA n=1 Tax=Tahibacter harae TaxID=2963937 RepID=A0ABT1QZ82_9GAMM|nr:hypothetical protein [Tahibacter harae]MCQ4167597.1 hypothetical protein [Tahibacter harae]
MFRSFGRCPECGQTWNGHATSEKQHYRNNAWVLCITCSREQGRCVVCGKPAQAPAGSA